MPRFTVIVPTVDRPNLLPAAVRAALAMNFQDFELIVSDNYSKIPATELLADQNDPRLRILRTEKRLPAADHWEFIWNHISGEFVIFVCDDDVLHPDTLAVADRLIRDHDPDILSWRVGLYYHPDWQIEYGTLPNRGNILSVDIGTTGGVYRCNPDRILDMFCQTLSLTAGFPCTNASLYRKSLGDEVRRRIGRLFWPPGADLSCSYFLLGLARPGRYIFLDAYGAIGGRSQQSNVGTMYSKGKGSRRLRDYIDEHAGQELFPLHEAKLFTTSNALGAVVSQARALMPERFGHLNYDRGLLARRILNDMYVVSCVPWVDDPDFLAQVDALIASLSPEQKIATLAYRTACRQHQRAEETAAAAQAARQAQSTNQPFWVVGGQIYVDMGPFGCRDIADVAKFLPTLLKSVNIQGSQFVDAMRENGVFGELLSAPADWQPLSPSATSPALAAVSNENRSGLVRSHLSVEG